MLVEVERLRPPFDHRVEQRLMPPFGQRRLQRLAEQGRDVEFAQPVGDRRLDHAAQPLLVERAQRVGDDPRRAERSEEHTSELQSLMSISYAVFCLDKTNTHTTPMRIYYT